MRKNCDKPSSNQTKLRIFLAKQPLYQVVGKTRNQTQKQTNKQKITTYLESYVKKKQKQTKTKQNKTKRTIRLIGLNSKQMAHQR